MHDCLLLLLFSCVVYCVVYCVLFILFYFIVLFLHELIIKHINNWHSIVLYINVWFCFMLQFRIYEMSDGSLENAVGSRVICATMASYSSASNVSVLAMDTPIIGLHSDSRIASVSQVQAAGQCLIADSPNACPADLPCKKADQFIETASIGVVSNGCWTAMSDGGSNAGDNDNIVIGSTGTQYNTFGDRFGQTNGDGCRDSALTDIVSGRSNRDSLPDSLSSNPVSNGEQAASSHSVSVLKGDEAGIELFNDGPGGASSSSDYFSSSPMRIYSASAQIQTDVGSSNYSSSNETNCLLATLEDAATSGILETNSCDISTTLNKMESSESHEALNKASEDFNEKNLTNAAAADLKLDSGEKLVEDTKGNENQDVHDADDSLHQFSTDFTIGDEFSFIQPGEKLDDSCDILPSFTNNSEFEIADCSLTTLRFQSSDSSFSREVLSVNQDSMAQLEDQCSNSSFSDNDSMTDDEGLSSATEKFTQKNVFSDPKLSDPKLNFRVFVKIDKLKLPVINSVSCSKESAVTPRKTDICNRSDYTGESVGPSIASQLIDPVEIKSQHLSISFDGSDSNPPSPDYLTNLDFLCVNNDDCNLKETCSQMDETLARVDRCSTPERELHRPEEGTSERLKSVPATGISSDSKVLASASADDEHHEPVLDEPCPKAGLVVAGVPTVSPVLREMTAEISAPYSHLKHQSNEMMSAVSNWHQHLNDACYQPFVKLVRLPLEFFQIVMASREAKMVQSLRERFVNICTIISLCRHPLDC